MNVDASCALGTVRPRWDDLSDIPGATRQIQYQRPTPYDAFLYDDVAKGVKTFRGGYEPRSTKFEKIDIGKLPEVPFRRSIPSNPLAGFIPYGPPIGSHSHYYEAAAASTLVRNSSPSHFFSICRHDTRFRFQLKA